MTIRIVHSVLAATKIHSQYERSFFRFFLSFASAFDLASFVAVSATRALLAWSREVFSRVLTLLRLRQWVYAHQVTALFVFLFFAADLFRSLAYSTCIRRSLRRRVPPWLFGRRHFLLLSVGRYTCLRLSKQLYFLSIANPSRKRTCSVLPSFSFCLDFSLILHD